MVNKGSTKGFELALFMAYGMFSITNTIHLGLQLLLTQLQESCKSEVKKDITFGFFFFNCINFRL